MDQSLDAVRVTVDGREQDVPFGRVLGVEESVSVPSAGGLARVNAIGFDSGRRDESGIVLRLKDFMPRFSVDRGGRLYRVEVYKKQRFSGMFLVRFGKNNTRMAKRDAVLPDRPGPESSLGF